MDHKEEMIKLESRIIEQLRTIYDPEIPVSIYDLGLVYEINVDQEMNVEIIMTLTSPNCPVAESLPAEVNEKVRGIEKANQVRVELVFEPPWSMDMMTEEAKLELGFL